jgi:hypothetical protein
MDQPTKRTAVTLRDTEAPMKWAILFLLSLGCLVARSIGPAILVTMVQQ